eukprot:TRINITY_DN1081_c2_g1_i1.p1 TRINITY_DN1081_c2_g1~~TRINITY_DN1081_c2_g1_i1.p1  ORF type:complete len:386 (+),score=76.94 TRINITY_DN1081_c2_g1_i1:138-1160(+)
MAATSATPLPLAGAQRHFEGLQKCVAEELSKLDASRVALEKERVQFEDAKRRIAMVHFASTVKLDVGGRIFRTSLATLTKETSMLSQMFSGSGFKVEKDEDGSYFIDRSGKHFDTILNYLRTGVLVKPTDPAALEELKIEADFYQLESLIKLLTQESFTFHSVNDMDGLLYWLGCNKGTSPYKSPKQLGLVTVKTSDNTEGISASYPGYSVSSPPGCDFVAHPTLSCQGGWCNDARGKYFTVSLTEGLLFNPNYYALSFSNTCHRPACWRVEGCHDGNWVTLKAHKNDPSLKTQPRAAWPLSCQDFCSEFRVTCTGHDHENAGCNCFHVSCFELYGTLLL